MRKIADRERNRNGRFPPGYRDPRPDAQPGPGWGWPVFLLPFVEQTSLHAQIDPERTVLGNGMDISVPTPPTLTQLAVFRCRKAFTDSFFRVPLVGRGPAGPRRPERSAANALHPDRAL